jgi:uncharacterized protein YndB with AHSA1/START domain
MAIVFSVPYVAATAMGWPALKAADAGLLAALVTALLLLAAVLVPATVTIEETLTVAAPREVVYRTTTDPRNHIRWSPVVMAVRDLTGDPAVTGTRWHTQYAPRVTYVVEVLAAEPPVRNVIRSRTVTSGMRRPTTIVSERTYREVPNATEVHVRQVVHTQLVGRAALRLQRSSRERQRMWSNARLRAELEAG